MRVLDRFRTGLAMIKQSVSILRGHPKLAVFPVLSGVFGLAFLALVLTPMLGVLALDSGETATLVAGVAVVATLYLGTAFITAFFTAALVHQTKAVLDGAEPSLRDGINGAWEVKGPLFVWAFISATVGVVLDAIAESDSTVGQVLSAVFGIAWTLLTFFVIPVIVFEKPSVRGMFKRSAGLFKETFGETPISLFGVNVLAVLVALPVLAPGAYFLFVAERAVVGLPLFVVGVLIGQLLSSTLRGIVKTALYVYSTEGTHPDEMGGMIDQLGDRGGYGTTGGPRTGGVR